MDVAGVGADGVGAAGVGAAGVGAADVDASKFVGGVGGSVVGVMRSLSAIVMRINFRWVSLSLSTFGISGIAGIGNSPGNGGRLRLDVLNDTSPASSYSASNLLTDAMEAILGVELEIASERCVLCLLMLLLLLGLTLSLELLLLLTSLELSLAPLSFLPLSFTFLFLFLDLVILVVCGEMHRSTGEQ